MTMYLRRIIPAGLLAVLSLLAAAGLYAQTPTEPQTNHDERTFPYSDSGAACDPSPCVVDVLENDLPAGPWVASTVRIIDPGDLTTPLTKYVEPDQGIWEVDQSNGEITFTPCTGAGAPDAQCTAALNTDKPYPIDYVVEDGTQALSNPSSVAITFADSTPLNESLIYFSNELVDGVTEFTWVMATQNGTAGFDLLVERDEMLQPINDGLIVATEPDSLVPQLYEYAAEVEEATYYLRELSIGGAGTLYGPFTRGESFGENPFENGDQSLQVFLPLVSVNSTAQSP